MEQHSITKSLNITRRHKVMSRERHDIGFPCQKTEIKIFQIRNKNASKVLVDISVQ